MFVALDGKFAGLIAVADPIKDTTLDAIQQLKQEGIRVLMVTGDNHTTAAAVAAKLGIDFEADVLPKKKAEVVKELQAEGAIVAMAGDGVNDAPALAQANVGIAMGTGTDVAMKTGGITLVKGDLRGIVKARRLSQRTMSNIREKLVLRVLLQRARGASGGWRSLPVLRTAAEPNDRRCCHELQLSLRDCQCFEATDNKAVNRWAQALFALRGGSLEIR
jgi:cation transport ATPase